MREYAKDYVKRPYVIEVRRECARRLVREGKQKAWQRDNPDKLDIYGERRKSKKHTITTKEWNLCKVYFDNSCAYCGMTYEEHKEEFKQDLHKEHVDHEGANDISNCVPSCKSCNSSKGSNSLNEWYRQDNAFCDYFSKDKLKKINKWLDFDYLLLEAIK